METALKEAGSDMSKVLKVTAMLDDIKDYNEFNEIYLTFFSDVNTRPARVCYAPGGLPFGALVEIECTAML